MIAVILVALAAISSLSVASPESAPALVILVNDPLPAECMGCTPTVGTPTATDDFLECSACGKTGTAGQMVIATPVTEPGACDAAKDCKPKKNCKYTTTIDLQLGCHSELYFTSHAYEATINCGDRTRTTRSITGIEFKLEAECKRKGDDGITPGTDAEIFSVYCNCDGGDAIGMYHKTLSCSLCEPGN